MAGKSSKSSFVWQGVLILLPVLLMAGFGTWAILRERKAVVQDAKQRAQELLQSLPYNFSLRVASRMGMLTSQSANENVLPEKAADFESSETNQSTEEWGAAGNLMPDSFTNVLWTSLPGEVWPMNFLLATNGDVWDLTYHEAPQPPPWFGELDDKQRAAWAALREADLNKSPAQEVSKRFDDFINTEPPSDARECAEFMRLRAQTAAQSDADALKSLLEFARNCTDVASEGGVPLSNLVLAEALRRSTPGGASAAIRKQLQFEVCYRPSLLSAELIDQAEHVAGSDAAFTDLLHTLLGICDAREVQRQLAEQIKLADVQRGTETITNVWVDVLGQRWLCVLQPESLVRYNAVKSGGTNQIVSVRTNVFTEVIPYPKSFLTKSLEESVTEARMSVPDYFAVSSELEGEPILPEIFWRKGVDARQLNAIFERALSREHLPPEDILAEQEMTLSLPSSSTEINPDGTAAGSVHFEAMPSHPRFTIRILLIDRPLLYARQRQRQVIFGALMVFSVAAALIGFMAARRAFTTQLRLSEAKSNFVSSVSHELRAPIASVRLMAESLERGKVAEGAKQNEYYRFIVQECRRLSALIENVLDFSRIEQGRKQYEFEPTDVLALTRETVKLMEPYAEERGVQLKLETSLAAPKHSEGGNIQHPTSNIELEMDGRAIQQAVVNLIDNAIKHSAKGQTVTIGLDAEQRASGASANGSLPVLLYVEDHGPGIPPAEHEKIFERFYRLGSELRRETQGVGIGLSIVRHIIAAHGGKVTVRSNVGEGSRFTIVLPRINAKTQIIGGAKKT